MTMKRRKIAEFTDQYGDTRVIHKDKKRGLSVARDRVTPTLAFNRTAAVKMGQRIRERRVAAGMTMADLCVKAGLVAGASREKHRIWEIERGVRVQAVRIGTLYALAIALKCDVADLLPPAAEVLSETPDAYVNREGEVRMKGAASPLYKYEEAA